MRNLRETKAGGVIEFKESGKLAQKLDAFFQIGKRGSDLRSEIKAGVCSFLISMCFVFINMRLLASSGVLGVPANERYNYYAGLYLGSTVTSFFGTFLVGLLCNLPIVQASSLSCCNIFITLAGLECGMSYENTLVISFAAAIVYLVVMVTPAWKMILEAIPKSVKKALLVCYGILMVMTGLNMAIPNADFEALPSMTQLLTGNSDVYLHSGYEFVCGFVFVLAIVIYCVAVKNKKGAVATTLIAGTVIYYIAGCIFSFDKVIGQNKLFMIWDNYGSYNISTAFESLCKYNLLAVFECGMDFSTCEDPLKTGAVFITGVLMLLLVGATENAVAISSIKSIQQDSKKRTAHITAAVVNIAAPVLGAGPISMNVGSLAAEKEGGKTGLSALICSACYLGSMFTWAGFALFSTYNGQTAFGHAEFNAYAQANFGVIAAVVFCLGVSLLQNIRNCQLDHHFEACCFAATAVGTALSMNLAVGIALGTVADFLFNLFSFQFKALRIKNWITAIFALALMIMYFGVVK